MTSYNYLEMPNRTLIGFLKSLKEKYSEIDFNAVVLIVTSQTYFAPETTPPEIEENHDLYEDMCEIYGSILNLNHGKISNKDYIKSSRERHLGSVTKSTSHRKQKETTQRMCNRILTEKDSDNHESTSDTHKTDHLMFKRRIDTELKDNCVMLTTKYNAIDEHFNECSNSKTDSSFVTDEGISSDNSFDHNQQEKTIGCLVDEEIEKLNISGSSNSESEDTCTNSSIFPVQIPLCGNDKVNSFMDEDRKYKAAVEGIVENTLVQSDRTRENLEYDSEFIDTSYLNWFFPGVIGIPTISGSLNSESEDGNKRLTITPVQKPLCDNENVGMIETFKDEDWTSKAIPEVLVENTDIPIDQTTENLANEFGIIHASGIEKFSPGVIENPTTSSPLNSESEDAYQRLTISPVQKPLCDSENVGKIETSKNENWISKATPEALDENTSIPIDQTTENLAKEYGIFHTSCIEKFSPGVIENPTISSPLNREFEDDCTELTISPVRKPLCDNERKIETSNDKGWKTKAPTDALIEKTLIPIHQTETLENESEIVGKGSMKEISLGAIEEQSGISIDLSQGPIIEEETLSSDETKENQERRKREIGDQSRPKKESNSHSSKEQTRITLDLSQGPIIDEDTLSSDETKKNEERRKREIGDCYVPKNEGGSPSLVDSDPKGFLARTKKKSQRLKLQRKIEVDRSQVLGLKCHTCDRPFLDQNRLREHKKKHCSFVPSGADICSKYTRRYCIVLAYSVPRVQYKCSQCHKRFKSVGDFARHCGACPRKRSYMVSPMVFEYKLESGEKCYECQLCQENSTVFAELRAHECIIGRPKIVDEDSPSEDNFDSDDDHQKDDRSTEGNRGKKDGRSNKQDDSKKDGRSTKKNRNKKDGRSKEQDDSQKDYRSTDKNRKKEDGRSKEQDDSEEEDRSTEGDDSEVQEELHKCDICPIEFYYDSKSYYEHQREHLEGKRLECKVCYQTFSRLVNFIQHLKDNHKRKTKAIKLVDQRSTTA